MDEFFSVVWEAELSMPFYQGFSGTSQIRSILLWNSHSLNSKHEVVICAAQIRRGHRPLATDHRVRNEQRHWACFHRSDGHHLADGPVGIEEIHFFDHLHHFQWSNVWWGKLRAHIITLEGDLWDWRGTIVPESAHSLFSRGVHLLRRWRTSAWQQSAWQNAKDREQEKVKLKSFQALA